jgi:AAHS family 4-hydroxybenzoate transporter-like MFS transporter
MGKEMDLPEIDIRKTIDEAPIGAYRFSIFALCGFIALCDGFDTQSISIEAPAIAATWTVSAAQFGIAFGATLFAAMFGGIIFGILADRVGRRPMLALSLAVFALGSRGTAFAQSFQELSQPLCLRISGHHGPHDLPAQKPQDYQTKT